jgi:mannose-1-phosphate guanylyltransferase/mannose-6-phosphate isomerase
MAAEQLREMGAEPSAILLEPVGRNTAPAIAVAALEAMRDGEDALLLVLPSDHVIRDEAAFHAVVRAALPAAREGRLVTFGIVPTAPETGYGYIQAAAGEGVRAVAQFVEKPDRATAEAYLASGAYFWNSGMFLFRASRYLQELQRWQPAMLAACRQALDEARRDTDFVRLQAEHFAACPSDSIDYAVMEKTDAAAVIALDAGWNDVGSWAALWEATAQDAEGNAHHGDVIALNCRNTYAHASRLVAMIGLEDVVVVDTDDALLIAHRDQVQQVKDVVGKIKGSGRTHAVTHRKVYRPWGAYDSIDNGEHWIVVSGTAKVTRGDETILLAENQSTYIPLGVVHRLENPGRLPLELIEVQSGAYLGEDDIVRFEDVYGR